MADQKTFCLGLTGSIGMGKSTTARMFAEKACGVWDADAAVHRLYQRGQAGYAAVQMLVPDAATGENVDRNRLKQAIAADPTLLSRIEAVIHPLVAQDRAAFKVEAKAPILVFDIPLLYETGAESQFDAVACVAVPEEIQRQRVMQREGMSVQTFEMILSKQMPNADKTSRADFVIDTTTLVTAEADVERVIQQIRGQMANA